MFLQIEMMNFYRREIKMLIVMCIPVSPFITNLLQGNVCQKWFLNVLMLAFEKLQSLRIPAVHYKNEEFLIWKIAERLPSSSEMNLKALIVGISSIAFDASH